MPAQPPPGLRPLLSSFPFPPTHIPSSPAVSTPPLSATLGPPPTTPLPPLPDAPSPVTPAEQIAFINLRKSSLRIHRPRSQASSTSNEGSVRSVEREVEAQELLIHDDDDRALTPSPSVQTPTAHAHPVLSQGNEEEDDERDGATSPDVAVLIQRTHMPYQRRRTRSLQSGRGTGPPARVSDTPGLKRLRSTPVLGVYPGAAVDGEVWRTDRAASEDADAELDFDLDDSEDDVIDLRTPLPHLMLRAGLLSPHSKLLPRPSPSPEPIPTYLRDVDDGRTSPAGSVSTATSHTTTLSTKSSIASLSTASTAPTSTTSVTAKGPPPRDARDTARRRARHKDGRLLRGGIGLTTGLGWSDSEDEDAPSALTHRLSRLAPSLSRKSSRPSSAAFNGYSLVYASPGSGPAHGPPYPAPSGYTTSAPVSRAPSVTSSPARGPSLGLSGSLGPEGRSLSRSTVASQRSLRRTASGGSGSSIGDGREGTVLPYLAPPLETEERVYEAEGAKPQNAVPVEPELDLPIPDYPYTFSPPSPTDMGHSSIEHGDVEVDSSLKGPVIPRSPLFDAEDPFARQYHPAPVLASGAGQIQKLQVQIQNQVENRPPAQNSHQDQLQTPGAPEDRSPTPTSTGASQTEDPQLPLPGRSLPPRKSSMPVMGARAREDGVLTRLPRGLRPAGVEIGAPTRPPSKALPPLPAEIPQGSATTSASVASRPQSRACSGIPKTASMSSLRSVSSRQASTASPAPIPASTSMSMSMSSVPSVLQRERTTSNASAHSVRSVRSIASVASVRSVASGSTAVGSVRARPSLPTPKASSLPSASVIGNIPHTSTSPPLSFGSILSAPSTPGPRTSMPPSGTPTPRARKRTSSTSSTASGRPLKSAIKVSSAHEYSGGMATPRVRYVSGASPPVGVGITPGVGIAI